MPIKIAMIGAGSVGFTRRLMYDILSVPELADTHFALMDISRRSLDMIYQLSERDVRASKLPAKVETTMDRRASNRPKGTAPASKPAHTRAQRASIPAPLKRLRVTKLRPVPMLMPLTKAG